MFYLFSDSVISFVSVVLELSVVSEFSVVCCAVSFSLEFGGLSFIRKLIRHFY